MTILGPDGQPVGAGGGGLVGQSLRSEDFAPLSAPEIKEMAAPLQNMLTAGMSPQQPAQVISGVLARLLSTIFHMSEAIQQLRDVHGELAEALIAHGNLPSHLVGKRLNAPNHEQNAADAQDCIDQYGKLISKLKDENPDTVKRIMDRRYPAEGSD